MAMGGASGTRLWARPAAAVHAAGTGTDLLRSRAQRLAANALLRQQLVVLRRSTKRPAMTTTDRALLVLLAGQVRAWRQALLIVRPETLLRWHRVGFRALWTRRSWPGPGRPPLPAETVALIRQMAAETPLWGAERTIQTYRRGAYAPRPRGQAWATFLRNHTESNWACDFLQVTDLLFRPLFAFFVVDLASRRVVHMGAMRHPTDAWVAQHLREATPFEQRPRYLIRDNDAKFGRAFAGVAEDSGGERQLARVLREYVAYVNRDRPHQDLAQATPGPSPNMTGHGAEQIRAVPVLGGLHHTYQRAA